MPDTKNTAAFLQLSEIVFPLLSWYAANKRALPWRKNITVYRVLVSEFMLQQTRVETVIPYYQRFLHELPTLQALAEAPEEKLLKLWEGLGYYNRVRNLQKTARIIMDQHRGKFPDHYETLLTLPGIGEYTAGAIASIAFGQPIPAVDGNVLRVICRLTENRNDIRSAKTKAVVRTALQAIYPPEHSADFTQALMDLGAVQCLPVATPECGQCPLHSHCLAFAHGSVGEIPAKAPSKPRKIEKKTVLLLSCNGKTAICRRQQTGLLAGLWEFPMLDGWSKRTDIERFLKESHVEYQALTETIRAKHIFSHLEWHMRGWKAECAKETPQWRWVTPEEMHSTITLPTALQPYREQLWESVLSAGKHSVAVF